MKKERKIPLAVKILIPVAVILILAVGAILFVQAKLNQISRVDEESVEKVDPSQEDFEIDEELAQEIAENKVDALDPDEVQWNNADIDVMQGQGCVQYPADRTGPPGRTGAAAFRQHDYLQY